MLASTHASQNLGRLSAQGCPDESAKRFDATIDEWARLRRDLQWAGEQVLQIVARLDNLVASATLGDHSVGTLFAVTALTDQSQKLLARATDAMGDFGGAMTNLNVPMSVGPKGAAPAPMLDPPSSTRSRTDATVLSATEIPESKATRGPPMKATTSPGKKRVLVVDDRPRDTRLVKLCLEMTDAYDVREENDANAAVTTAEMFQPQLILLDVMMPGMDGGVLASKFHANPKLQGVPVVFLTALITKEEVTAAGGRLGDYPILAKPIVPSELVACLRQHLGE